MTGPLALECRGGPSPLWAVGLRTATLRCFHSIEHPFFFFMRKEIQVFIGRILVLAETVQAV